MAGLCFYFAAKLVATADDPGCPFSAQDALNKFVSLDHLVGAGYGWPCYRHAYQCDEFAPLQFHPQLGMAWLKAALTPSISSYP
jgi:hypothetical protein